MSYKLILFSGGREFHEFWLKGSVCCPSDAKNAWAVERAVQNNLKAKTSWTYDLEGKVCAGVAVDLPNNKMEAFFHLRCKEEKLPFICTIKCREKCKNTAEISE